MSIFTSLKARLAMFSERIETMLTKWHRPYLAIVCLFALVGYAFVLLFPVLIIAAGSNIYESLASGDSFDWQRAIIWFVILIFSALLSFRSSQVKSSPPAGLTITEVKMPEIFKLLQQLHAHFKRPAINQVIITSNYELDIVKLPKWALPVWSSNVMVIGLPVLLCHSPKQFECLMASRIGQFSKQHNPISNWLYQLRAIWRQYGVSYGKLKSPDSKILQWFYMVYAPLYEAVSVRAARRDELYADTYATELHIDVDVREMITADAIYRWYLQNTYWPAVEKIASVKTKPPLTPYHKISTTIHTILKGEKLTSLIDEVFNAKNQRKDPVPSLHSRLENVGHDTPFMSETTDVTAASHYLGAHHNSVINLIDKLWLKNNLEKRSK